MKRIIITLFIIVCFISCKNETKKNIKEDFVVLAGIIKNANSDSLVIQNSYMDVLKTIKLKNDSVFNDTIDVEEGKYYININKSYIELFLKPGYNISLKTDAKNVNESLIYSGKGAPENDYVNKKRLKRESFGNLRYYGYFAKLPENKFLNLKDSLNNVLVDLLNQHKSKLNDEFYILEKKSLELELLHEYYQYEGMHKYVTGDKDFKVSDSFPNPFTYTDLNNESLLSSSDYLFYLQSFLNKKTIDYIDDNKALDYYAQNVKIVDKEITNSKVKEKLAYSIGKEALNYTKQLDSVYNGVSMMISDKNKLNEITEIYNKLKRIAKGATSPDFKFKDINGKEYTLASFKGKPVYIDIWATWCMPCIKEIPDLKKLEKEFHNSITFVSIAYNDDKARWEKYIKDENLGGVQLFTTDSNVSFFKEYNVAGIPRFILIDKEGKIIDSNAKRPSNPEIREELKALL